MKLKDMRKQKKLTQYECATYLGIPLRGKANIKM